MSFSLSFVFPAYNAEAHLRKEVRHVLELLAELATTFELLVIDDGSTDDTLGEARDLARRYAQVRVLHRPLHYGHSAAVQLGLMETDSPFIMIYNNLSCRIGAEIRELWDNRLVRPDQRDEPSSQRNHVRETCRSSMISDHGTVFEAGPLLMVHRWEFADRTHLVDFVRSPAGMHTRPRHTMTTEIVAQPMYLTALTAAGGR